MYMCVYIYIYIYVYVHMLLIESQKTVRVLHAQAGRPGVEVLRGPAERARALLREGGLYMYIERDIDR